MLIERIMKIREAGKTTAAEYKKRKCDNCSILELCMPKSTGTGHKQVEKYINNQLKLVEKMDAKIT